MLNNAKYIDILVSVSYTNLTLPTTYPVQNLVLAPPLKKKNLSTDSSHLILFAAAMHRLYTPTYLTSALMLSCIT
ncbi:hypothetical protein, partial [Staphylococcus aureus]|uniref:hypothetical protein n=1 Tax=Staphylococcus aureus TaxID=1280 RepID=UPI0019D5DE55